MNTDAHRPQFTYLLEVKGWMLWIQFEKTVVLLCNRADVLGEGLVLGPEPRGYVVLQSSRVLPVL